MLMEWTGQKTCELSKRQIPKLLRDLPLVRDNNSDEPIPFPVFPFPGLKEPWIKLRLLRVGELGERIFDLGRLNNSTPTRAKRFPLPVKTISRKTPH